MADVRCRTWATSTDGFTLLEALLAVLLTALVAGSALLLLIPGESAVQSQPEAADLQQRARGVAEALGRDLTMAGAGVDFGEGAGSLIRTFAPIVPRILGVRGDPPETARADAISLIYVPGAAVQATTSAIWSEGAPLMLEDEPNCFGRTLCGLQAGMTLVIFDRTGQHDLLTVERVDSGSAQVQLRGSSTAYDYPAGSRVAQVVSRAYYLDAPADGLRQYDGLATDAPLADNVVGLSFEYVGDSRSPVLPVPQTGVANCLYDASGTFQPLPTLSALAGNVALLPLSMLDDGPWCGDGDNRFDADLLRVRGVRLTIRLQAGLAEFRSNGPAFLRPGTSRDSRRYLPDLTLTFQVWPPNLGFV